MRTVKFKFEGHPGMAHPYQGGVFIQWRTLSCDLTSLRADSQLRAAIESALASAGVAA